MKVSLLIRGQMILIWELEARHIFRRYVLKKSVADLGVSVRLPLKHRVDCLGELSATRFVDAARIDPGIHIAILLGLRACILEFGEGCLLVGRAVDHIRKEYFI
jgi:hypothetical protein